MKLASELEQDSNVAFVLITNQDGLTLQKVVLSELAIPDDGQSSYMFSPWIGTQ